jgi:hypothetical protein
MKKTNLNRKLAFLMAVLLLAGSFTACKNAGAETTAEPTQNQVQTQAPTQEPTQTPAEPLQIRVNLPGGASLAEREKTIIEKEIETRANVELIYEGALGIVILIKSISS